jgi:DNA-binding NtrC family response regulator
VSASPQHELIGQSPPIQALRALIGRVAVTDLPVLIDGETGTGKEVVAAAIHRASGRPGALVPINVCAIAETMFEPTLFGHVRGAFTGATGASAGYLAESHRGTLFLDEISSMTPGGQAKLLRAIETRAFRPVGAQSDRHSDFRVVAATNEDLDALASTGRFRRDLLQRLRGIRLQLPPLRARREDIVLLVEHFLRGTAVLGGVRASIDAEAMRQLIAHEWPGNVRELRQVVECAVALAGDGRIGLTEVEPLLVGRPPGTGAWRRQDFERHGLLRAMEANRGDIDAVALSLGVHRATVYRRLKRLQVDEPWPALGAVRSASA